MRVMMTKPAPEELVEVTEKMTVMVLYEDGVTHDRARSVCDNLLDRFWGELEFELTWWRFDYLRTSPMAEAAVESAVKAQLVIISAHAGENLPESVRDWIENWIPKRGLRRGALAALIGVGRETGAAPIIGYLRQVAERAQMEYLFKGMLGGLPPMPELGPETRALRGEVSAALNRILDPHSHPRHWGINE
jgi:hypothetical protein